MGSTASKDETTTDSGAAAGPPDDDSEEDMGEQIKKEDELRIVLVGKTGVGKSATGNTILGTKSFQAKLSSSSVTAECSKKEGEFGGQSLSIVDTPGLFDTKRNEEEIVKEIKKCICLSSPGPHVFLVVIQAGRFTQEELDTVQIIQTTFGEEAGCYTMVVFTKGDELEEEGRSIEEFFREHEHLNNFVKQCKGGYHVFNNKSKDPSPQVLELLQKVKKMMEVNGGSHYTNELFQLAEKSIRREIKEILKKYPHLTVREARKIAEKNNTFIKKYPFVWAAVGATVGLITAGAVGAVAFLAAPIVLAAAPIAGALALAGAGGSAAAGLTAGVTAKLKVPDKCKVQ